jgi:hypothetical protein
MNDEEHINFEDYIERYGSLTYRNKGTSMMPLLRQGRDLFTIVKKGPERCRKYDVVLYKDAKGHHILHRVIKVVPEGYIIRGDNTYRNEFRTDAEIIGVMTGLTRDGREISTEDLFYKLYSVLRNASYPFRYVYLQLRRAAGKLLKRNKD